MRHHLDELITGKEFDLHGTSRSPKESVAYYLATSKKLKGPQLVVTESMEEAKLFEESFSFWSNKPVHILPAYDPHLFAGVQLSIHQVHERLSWLYKALNENESHIFVAPVLGLLQKTMPIETFLDHCFYYCVGV